MADHVEQLKKRVCAAIDRRAAELIETADWIHAHPEIGHQEVEASRRLSGLLLSAGIPVEMGTAGMATAFKAELGGLRGGRPRGALVWRWPKSSRSSTARSGCSARPPRKAPRPTQAGRRTWSTPASSRTS